MFSFHAMMGNCWPVFFDFLVLPAIMLPLTAVRVKLILKHLVKSSKSAAVFKLVFYAGKW